MTPGELRALVDREVSVSFLQAVDAFGLGETCARKALKRGDALPFRVIRVGKALRVPAVDLAVLLQRVEATR